MKKVKWIIRPKSEKKAVASQFTMVPMEHKDLRFQIAERGFRMVLHYICWLADSMVSPNNKYFGERSVSTVKSCENRKIQIQATRMSKQTKQLTSFGLRSGRSKGCSDWNRQPKSSFRYIGRNLSKRATKRGQYEKRNAGSYKEICKQDPNFKEWNLYQTTTRAGLLKLLWATNHLCHWRRSFGAARFVATSSR